MDKKIKTLLIVIAGVIAFFIIMSFILTVMESELYPNLPIEDPNIEAGMKVKTLISSLGVPEKTVKVTFNSDNRFLNASTISKLTGALTSEQICVDAPPDSSNVFDRISDRVVEFKANQEIRTNLLVVCDSLDKIDKTINDTGISDAFPNCKGKENNKEINCFVSIIPTDY